MTCFWARHRARLPNQFQEHMDWVTNLWMSTADTRNLATTSPSAAIDRNEKPHPLTAFSANVVCFGGHWRCCDTKHGTRDTKTGSPKRSKQKHGWTKSDMCTGPPRFAMQCSLCSALLLYAGQRYKKKAVLCCNHFNFASHRMPRIPVGPPRLNPVCGSCGAAEIPLFNSTFSTAANQGRCRFRSGTKVLSLSLTLCPCRSWFCILSPPLDEV